jgi:hypothetical protein
MSRVHTALWSVVCFGTYNRKRDIHINVKTEYYVAQAILHNLVCNVAHTLDILFDGAHIF